MVKIKSRSGNDSKWEREMGGNNSRRWMIAERKNGITLVPCEFCCTFMGFDLAKNAEPCDEQKLKVSPEIQKNSIKLESTEEKPAAINSA